MNWNNLATYIYDRNLDVKVYLKREIGLEVNPNSNKDPRDIKEAKKFLSVAFGFDVLDMRYVGQASSTVHHYEMFVRSDQ